MSARKRYVLDANAFIEARRTYYGFDICPGYWQALLREHEARRVFSIDKVRAELLAGNDELSDWVRDTAPTTLFKGTADKRVIDAFRTMVNWVQNEAQFTPEAKAEFASAADGWVAAYAEANSLVVVTHEEYAPESKRRVPLPNVCLEFHIDYCNVFKMLRDLNAQFVLKRRR